MDFDLQWLLLGLPLTFALGWLASRLDLRQWKREQKDSPKAYYKGLNLLLNDQHDKAIDAFIEAVQQDPDTSDLHFALGNLFRRRGEFERAVQVLSAKPRQVTILGGYFSRYLAVMLAMQLDQVIANVDFVAEPLGHDIGKLLKLSHGGVAVVLDFRRYELVAKHAADLAKAQGATVIVITDQGLSPAAENADIVLPVSVDGIPFDSFVGLLALVEALVEAVLMATGDPGLARMKQWEETVQISRAYRASPDLPVQEEHEQS